MSRLARQPIAKKPEISVREEGGFVVVKGPKAELKVALLPHTTVAVEENAVWIKTEDSDSAAANAGTVWANVKNAIQGVETGFSKVLEIEGVGYKAALEGKTVVLSLGFSKPIRYELPEGLNAAIEKNTIIISGPDRQQVGQAAAEIRSFRKPEPYKGKGIHYKGEVIQRKVGKKAAATAS